MVFENCSKDTRTENTLISPEFTLLSDQQLTLSTLYVPFNSHSTINVYKTSVLGHIDALLGSSSVLSDPVGIENATTDICLPAGTYRLVFIASEVENVSSSMAVITGVFVSDLPCSYNTSIKGKVKSKLGYSIS